ncbi:MAG: ATP-binding protein [Chloroflexi bacterium]|nr:ATP-binding protein [Chloroflexota bacterium]
MRSEIFVGRDSAISEVDKFLEELVSSVAGIPKFMTIQGPGGIGKTKLLVKIQSVAAKKGITSTQIIDLQATVSRAELSLLSSIASSLQNNSFSTFFDALGAYNAAKAQEKYELHAHTVQAFVESCQIASEKHPILILLDTFEAIQNTRIGELLLNLLPQLGGRTGVIIAGRKPILTLLHRHKIESAFIVLAPFSLPETVSLAKLLYEAWGRDYDLDDKTVEAIHILAKGRPILLTLAIEWILENARPEEVIAIPKKRFERKMVEHIRTLRSDEDLAVMLMATANRRFNSSIMSLLTGWGVEACSDKCSQLARFSFVKSRHGENVFTLHDEMLWLINEYIDFPETFKDNTRKTLVVEFYDKEISQAADPQYRQALVAEKLYYQMFYAPDEALAFFDREMSLAVESCAFDFCDLLLTEMEVQQLTSEQADVVDLNRAEMLLKQYLPFDAKPILDRLLPRFDAERDSRYLSRVLEGLGECVVNGCTVMETDVVDAVELWKKSLQLCQEKGLEEREPIILRQLGFTCELLGWYEQAMSYYEQSLRFARQQGNSKLIASTLDEMGALYRKMNRPEEALSLLLESLDMKQTTGDKRVGQSYHVIGTTYRDLDKFPAAMEYLEKAEQFFQEIHDDLELVKVYGDIAWLKFLEGNLDLAQEYVDRSQRIAIARQFGREISENLHTYYHLALAREGLDKAMPYLEQGVTFSRKYMNTYILVDCLFHTAECAYEKRQWPKLTEALREIDEMVNRGFSALVLQGRAINVAGDMYYYQGNYEEAVANWEKGFTLIARHGKGRSGMAISFEDQLEKRRERMMHALHALGSEAAKRLKEHWTDQGLANEYPGVVEICEQVLRELE